MTELEQLRGEVVALREALQEIKGYLPSVEEVETLTPITWSSRLVAMYMTADEALASSPLSEKVAAVVSAAVDWCAFVWQEQEEKNSVEDRTECIKSNIEDYRRRKYSLLKAVDALQEVVSK